MNPQLEELASLYVLDHLDPAERAAFEARLAHDAGLAALTRDLESAMALRIRALPQQTPPAALAGRINAAIDRLAPEEEPPERLSIGAVIARWGVAAAIAVTVGTAAYMSLRRPPSPHVIFVGLDSETSTLADLPVAENPQNPDARFIQLASLAEKYWDKPEDLPVKPAAAAQAGRGYALFDPASNQGFIAIRQLPTVETGKRYHLWVLDAASGQIREAGILPLEGASRGLYFFSVAPGTGAKSERLDFFVTAEDVAVADPVQPHGKVVLGDRDF